MSNDECAVFLRVSTTDQTTSNQVGEVERLVAHRGLTEVARYVVSDSASHPGEEYRAALAQMLLDAHMGKWRTLVVWAADRLTREGIEALLRIVRKLSESGCTLISAQEPWLNGSDANTELMLAIAAWMARQESARRSERVKAGMARAKADGKVVGGRKPGAKDRKPRKRQGYSAEQARRRAEAAAGG
jgi:putative DNA-invertase from lambdoid prophage Rac